MARQPRNILVYPFVRDTEPLFLILRRADNGIWQGVSGGVEGPESSEEAAVRELGEELGLFDPPPILPLTMLVHRSPGNLNNLYGVPLALFVHRRISRPRRRQPALPGAARAGTRARSSSAAP